MVPSGRRLAISGNLILNIKNWFNGTDWPSNMKWPEENPYLDYYLLKEVRDIISYLRLLINKLWVFLLVLLKW